jgi:IS605 OrfB family transposase
MHILNHINKDKIKQSNHFLPTEIKCSTQKHSWFDIEHFNYGSNKDIQSKSIQLTTIRCKQIKITPTITQRKILIEWIELARLVYNQTVNYLKHNESKSFISLRPIIKSLFTDSFKHRINESKLPVHIIDNAIKDVLKARKTAFTLLKLKYIKHFKLRSKKQSKLTQTIIIDQQDFSKVKNSFYIKALGEINSSLPINRSNITHDCKLTYDRNKNIFILHSPRDITITESVERFNSCGIDPGLKTFLTVYNPEKECIKIMNRDSSKKLSRLINKKINLLKLDRTRVVKKAILRNNRKIYNNVKELHYKTAHLLCKSYNNIYLGKLSTQSIVKGNLTTFDKHFAHALSHFTFSQILENKCNEFGKKLYYVDESYTSKTCGSCGSIYDVKLSRVYSCISCLQKYDRDMNAARNILIKNE